MVLTLKTNFLQQVFSTGYSCYNQCLVFKAHIDYYKTMSDDEGIISTTQFKPLDFGQIFKLIKKKKKEQIVVKLLMYSVYEGNC